MKILILLILMTNSIIFAADEAPSLERDNLLIAKQINDLLSQSEIDFNKHDWTQLARKTQLNILFKDFTWWFDTLDQIKKDDNFNASCDKYYYKEDNNPMKEYLTKYIRKYCINNYLKGKQTLTEENFQFILDNHTYFFENRMFISHFRRYLQKNKFLTLNENFQNVLKVYVSDHFSSEVLNLIQDQKFKNVITKKRLESSKNKRIANVEKNRIKGLFKKLKKNKNVFDSFSINEKLLEFNFYRENIYRIIHYYIRNKNKEKSISFLNKVIDHQNLDAELAFLYIWWGVRFGEEKQVLDKIKLSEEFSKEPKTMFWYAVSLQNVERKDEAIAIYKKIIEDYTVNYYAIMSSKKLKNIEPHSDYLKNHIMKNKHVHEKYTLKADVATRLDRLDLWININARKILEMDIRSIQSEPNKEIYNEAAAAKHNDKHQINLMIAEKLHENEYSLMAFRFFFELFNKQDVTLLDLKALHPVKQLETIQKYNQTLDPLVIISLIKQESGFNSRAKSHVGASGLMQIMPATARRLSGKRRNDLQNVEYNIKLGTKYLDLLNKRWDNNLVFVLSSYNAGEARVQDWIKNYFNGDDLVANIEAIPFLETNNYVKLIFRNLYFYKMTQNTALIDNSKTNYFYDVYLGF